MREVSKQAIADFGQNEVLRAIREDRWTVRDYERLLLTIHFQVFQGTMSFAGAAAKLPPRFVKLREFLVHHANEEMRHYEWIEDDLQSIGYQGPDPKTLLPSPAALAYVSFNEYNALHKPWARLASSTVLEGLASQLGASDALKAIDSLGLTPKNFSFFLRHGETDQGHIQDLWSVIGDLDLDDEQWAWMKHSARTAGFFYKAMYDRTMSDGAGF